MVVCTPHTQPAGRCDGGSGPEEQLLRDDFKRYHIKGLRRRERLWAFLVNCSSGKAWIRVNMLAV